RLDKFAGCGLYPSTERCHGANPVSAPPSTERGKLASNDKIVCRDDGPNIVIAPVEPNVVYAPYYNPAVVYGTWPWVEYPPVYFSPAYFGVGSLGVGVGWSWGPAWPIVPAFW